METSALSNIFKVNNSQIKKYLDATTSLYNYILASSFNPKTILEPWTSPKKTRVLGVPPQLQLLENSWRHLEVDLCSRQVVGWVGVAGCFFQGDGMLDNLMVSQQRKPTNKKNMIQWNRKFPQVFWCFLRYLISGIIFLFIMMKVEYRRWIFPDFPGLPNPCEVTSLTPTPNQGSCP